MKRHALCMALALAAGLTGCGRHDNGNTASGSSASQETNTASSAGASSGTATAPSTSSAPEAPPAATASANASDTGAMGAAAAGGNGQAVFSQTCAVCHAAGVAGAPKLGDKADWGPRIKQGQNVLYQHALSGFTGKKGTMPPKGGNTALPDADVKSAVDYMVSQGK